MKRVAKPAHPSMWVIGAAVVLAAISTSATTGTYTVRGSWQANVGACQTFDVTRPFPLVATRGCFESPNGGAQASAGAGFGSLSSGATIGNGLGLPVAADAFNLPGGVTVNSGNRLIDNRVVVPEPEAGVMLLAGLGLLSAAAGRRAGYDAIR